MATAEPSDGAPNPIAGYGMPGGGGRQPVAYVGPDPVRVPDPVPGRRPVVAVLDTGCGAHRWLRGPDCPRPVVRTGVPLRPGVPIGYVDDQTDPEIMPDQAGPLDGLIDEYSGHGTFICGLVHQACPDADILAWRIIGSAGPVRESDIIEALDRILELAESYRADPATGHPIDVLSLSLGYYHETPAPELVDATLVEIVRRFGASGTLVVCSAGNDATARPMFPAAFGPWLFGTPPTPQDPDGLPVVSVGALNPNARSDALFSNAGPWVRVYVPGASVVSTLPAFEGGLQSVARADAYQRRRDSIDPDDYRGGFAIWSGTSFAAPLLAGTLARTLAEELLTEDPADDPAAARERAWRAVERHTDLRRHPKPD